MHVNRKSEHFELNLAKVGSASGVHEVQVIKLHSVIIFPSHSQKRVSVFCTYTLLSRKLPLLSANACTEFYQIRQEVLFFCLQGRDICKQDTWKWNS